MCKNMPHFTPGREYPAKTEEMAISRDKKPKYFKSKGLSFPHISLFSLNMKDEDQFFPQYKYTPNFK